MRDQLFLIPFCFGQDCCHQSAANIRVRMAVLYYAFEVEVLEVVAC